MKAARSRPGKGSAAGPVFVRPGDRTAPPGHVMLVPGALVPAIALDLPAGVRGLQRERIAERQLRDLMNLHPGEVDIRPLRDPADPQAWSRVLVADVARIAEWRRAAPAGCRSVLPDYLALPTAPGLWTLSHADGTVSARLGPQDGFSIEADLAELILSRALSGAAPRAVLWLGPRLAGIDALLGPSGCPVLSSVAAVAAAGLPAPQVLAHGEEGCDLRLDPQRERDRLNRLVLPWRWPLAAALVAVGLWCAALALETRQARVDAAGLRAEIAAAVRAGFVPEGPILDVRIQVSAALEAMRDRLRAQRARTSPLDLVARAAGALAAQGAEVDELAYSRAEGLGVDLRVPDFAAQEDLAAALRAAGLSVEIVESGLTSGGGEVRVTLVLRAAGAEP